jgi:hypothetical protein
MACPSFEHNLVIYFITFVARAILLSSVSKPAEASTIIIVVTITEVAHLTLSLVINMFATSIIALKAWCARAFGVFYISLSVP